MRSNETDDDAHSRAFAYASDTALYQHSHTLEESYMMQVLATMSETCGHCTIAAALVALNRLESYIGNDDDNKRDFGLHRFTNASTVGMIRTSN